MVITVVMMIMPLDVNGVIVRESCVDALFSDMETAKKYCEEHQCNNIQYEIIEKGLNEECLK